MLTTWHDRSYTPVVDLDSELLDHGESTDNVEQTADLASSADELYSQGYVLVGYSKFTHTLIPNIQAAYARMYAKDIGAARVLQAEPQRNGNVFAYTVTYWAKGKSFPLGAYYNDIPDETALYFPDSLRTAVGADGRRPVLVEAVVAGTPAEAAGLRQGELLVAVDGSSLAGTADLDERIAQLAGREATLTVWGLAGLRETTCTLGPRFVGAEGHGVEGLYYNRPWEFNDYANYQQYSQAFTQAWNDSIAAYRQAQEQSRRDAQLAYLGSEVSYLEGRIDELEHSPSHRDSRTLREQVSSSLEHRYKTDFDKWIGGD